MEPIVVCEDCGNLDRWEHPWQRYCGACEEKRKAQSVQPVKAQSDIVSQSDESGFTPWTPGYPWTPDQLADGSRMIVFSIPFSYATSKNRIYMRRNRGYVALRQEARAIRDLIASKVRTAMKATPFYQNKIWLDILVQKPDHRGDAVNVVDLVCDGIKRGIGIDDRWFCIRRLDWQIEKHNPLLLIGIRQDATENCMVCPRCGAIKPFSEFNKAKHNPMGVGGECKECRRAGRKMSKQRRSDLAQDCGHAHAAIAVNNSPEDRRATKTLPA